MDDTPSSMYIDPSFGSLITMSCQSQNGSDGQNSDAKLQQQGKAKAMSTHEQTTVFGGNGMDEFDDIEDGSGAFRRPNVADEICIANGRSFDSIRLAAQAGQEASMADAKLATLLDGPQRIPLKSFTLDDLSKSVFSKRHTRGGTPRLSLPVPTVDKEALSELTQTAAPNPSSRSDDVDEFSDEDAISNVFTSRSMHRNPTTLKRKGSLRGRPLERKASRFEFARTSGSCWPLL
jgi:hypothetical protein